MHENCQADEAKAAEREDGSEEVRVHKTAARPYAPTKAEAAEHYPLRLPYRSWCADCVDGCATSAHHRSENRPREGLTWCLDYCFFGAACGVCGDKDAADPVDGKRNMPILVAYDDVKGVFWRLKLPAKGANGGRCKVVLQSFRRLRLRRIRGDGEYRSGGADYSVEDGYCSSSHRRHGSDSLGGAMF